MIKEFYIELKKIKKNLIPLAKFDCAYYSKKYIDKTIRNKTIEYYSTNIICDIQMETLKEDVIDIVICYSPDISLVKMKVDDDYYIKKESFIKDINEFYNSINNNNMIDKMKLNKIKNRIAIVNNAINL